MKQELGYDEATRMFFCRLGISELEIRNTYDPARMMELIRDRLVDSIVYEMKCRLDPQCQAYVSAIEEKLRGVR